MKSRVYLVDGSALAYRSYFAFVGRPLTNSKGENTSAVYGVANMLLKLLREERPDYIGVVLDSRVPTFRHKRFPEYKANREKMPEEMRSQFPRILELISAMGLKTIEAPGFEADDVMGTLAKRLTKEGVEVVLVSGDKDFCQLVGDDVRVLNPGRAGENPVWVDRRQVEERFGVGPEKVVDVLALAGDSSDNIPGVPGIGPKTASKLVSKYGGLEEILGKLPIDGEERLSEKLSQFSEQARLSRELASICLEAPVSIELGDLRPGEPRNERLKSLLEDLEFKKLVSTIFEPSELRYEWTVVETEDEFEEFRRKARSWKKVGLAVLAGRHRFSLPVGFAVAASAKECFYLPLRRGGRDQGDLDLGARDPASAAQVSEALAVFVSDGGVLKCTHDLKTLLHSLSILGTRLEGPVFDAMLVAYLIDPSPANTISSITRRFVGVEWDSMDSFLGSSRGKVSLEDVPLEKLAQYGCGCAFIALRLQETMLPRLAGMGLVRLYEHVELPLAVVLFEMEKLGVAVDVDFLREMSDRLAQDIERIERDIFRFAGCHFNLNSPVQLSKVLFDDMGLPSVKKTREKRLHSTDEEVLEELAVHHDVAREILKYRQLTKLKGTYVDVFPKMIDPSTGRLHANFNQAVTATGRLSMSEPNLQNIPVRSEQGREIRKAFTAGEKGWILLSADYSQVELRLMAHFSGDEKLIETFKQNEDVHSNTASLLFGVSPDAVPPELRARAKVVNFGIIYGMSPYGLSKELGITTAEAKEFMAGYYRLYPGVAEYVRRTIEEARRNGCATTLLGRRRPLETLKSENSRVRAEAERMAINTPIQGSAADMIKLAMIAISKELGVLGLRARLILQIHDELLFELPREEGTKLSELVRHEMEHALELRVPVRVEICEGENWFETH
ncbi:MAG: DNA polymerase I [Candidatus Eisenbacteria bacterium]|nr:DNA polymerase I [Candidatus Eisenbacteria bacterium]